MKTVINIEGKEYRFKGFSNFTTLKFNEVAKLLEVDDNGIFTILTELFGIPPVVVAKLDIESILQVDFNTITRGEIESYKLKDSYFGRNVPDWKGLTIGKFGDIEHFFSVPHDNRIAMTVAAILLDEEEDVDDHVGLTERLISGMKLGDLLAVYRSFENFRTDLLGRYEGLFVLNERNEEVDTEDDTEEDDTEEDDGDSGWGWLGAIYSLTNDDITKVEEVSGMKLIKCLNFMSFRKEEAERIKAETSRENSSLR